MIKLVLRALGEGSFNIVRKGLLKQALSIRYKTGCCSVGQ